MIQYTIYAEVNGEFKIIDKSELISAKLKRGLAKVESLTLTFSKDNAALDYLFEPGCIIMVGDLHYQIFAGRIITQAEDFYLTNTIECEGLRGYLLDSIVRPYEFSGTPEDYLKQLLKSHNSQVDEYKQFEIDYCDIVDTDNNNYITRANSNYPNTYNEFTDKLCNSLGAYFETYRSNGTNYIYGYQEAGIYRNSQKVVFGENILDLTRKKDFGDIKTAIIPVGKDGLTIEHMLTESEPSDWSTKWQDYCTKSGDTYTRLTSSSAPTWEANKYYYYLDYVYDSTAVAKYGLIYDTLTLDDVTTTRALKRKAEVHLESLVNPLNNVTVKAIDLTCVDSDIESFWIGYCEVDSPAHGIKDKQMLITEMETDLLDATNNTLTFGSEIKSLTYSTSNDTVAIGKKVEQVKEQNFDAVENATSLITGSKGGYVVIDKDEDGKPYQILIMDNKDKALATNVIRFNKNGMGFSTTGYDGVYRNAWTIDGNLVADFITSGVLNGVEVNANKGNIGGWTLSDDTLTATATVYPYTFSTTITKQATFKLKIPKEGHITSDNINMLEIYLDDELVTYFRADGYIYSKQMAVGTSDIDVCTINDYISHHQAGIYPVNFVKVTKSVTVGANATLAVDFGLLSDYNPKSDLLSFMGVMLNYGGYGDQWLISASNYNGKLIAMVKSNWGEPLTANITLTLVYAYDYKEHIPSGHYITPCITEHNI